MKILTKHFGEIDIDRETTLKFKDGLFGFEDEKEFALLQFSEEDGFLLSLQSIKTPYLAFTVVNPFMLINDYKPVLSSDELKEMQVEKSEDLCFYNMCTINKPVSNSTINLRCPIVINDETRQAKQIILDNYEMRFSLSNLEKGACK